MVIKKENKTVKIVAIAYIVLSLIFIVYSALNYLKFNIYNMWMQNWYETAINQIIAESTKGCSELPLESWDKKVNLINTACLKQVKGNTEK